MNQPREQTDQQTTGDQHFRYQRSTSRDKQHMYKKYHITIHQDREARMVQEDHHTDESEDEDDKTDEDD